MHDQFDVTLNDPELLEELELCADLMVAANLSDSPLSPGTIDRILRVGPDDATQAMPQEGIPPPRQG